MLPGRAGELVRVVLLVSEERVNAARTVSTIVVERLLDILTLLAILVLMLSIRQAAARHDPRRAGVGYSCPGRRGVMVVLSFWKERVLGWAHADPGPGEVPCIRPGIYAAWLGHLIDWLRYACGAGWACC